jgi:thiosulfate/3-mercaptopyruvate sulfurtransferase
LLNGGLKKWVEEGRSTESTPNTGADADYEYTFNPSLYATYEQVLEIDAQFKEGNRTTQIVDPRNDQMWDNGHIESATHVVLVNFQNPDTTLKTQEEILKALQDNGVDTSNRIVTNCNSGMMATLAYAALSSAGLNNLAVYDGSWTEYVNI